MVVECAFKCSDTSLSIGLRQIYIILMPSSRGVKEKGFALFPKGTPSGKPTSFFVLIQKTKQKKSPIGMPMAKAASNFIAKLQFKPAAR